jgi:PKD repeat protein
MVKKTSKYPRNNFYLFCFIFAVFNFLFFPAPKAFSASPITLEWSPNSETDLAGYRVFCREEGQSYDYANPSWEGTDATYTIYDLEENNTYCCVVRAFDTQGFESDDSNEVCFEVIADENYSPQVSIFADVTSGIIPLSVYFDGSGSYDPDGEIVSYDWDFGDGATGSGDTVSHTFTAAGEYTVTLTVTDDQGAAVSETVEISADSGSETDADVGSELEIEAEDMSIKTTGGAVADGWNIWSNGYIADTVDFSTQGTYTFEVEARGTYAGAGWPIMEVRIDQNEVGTVTVNTSDWAVYTIQAYVSSGTHEVAVAFTNDYYRSGQDRNLYVDKVTITDADDNLFPEISIFADVTSGTIPLSVYLDGSGSYDPDGEIVSYDWDFGDGATGSGNTVSHTFTAAGEYTVTLTVADDQGATVSKTIEISADSGSEKVETTSGSTFTRWSSWWLWTWSRRR